MYANEQLSYSPISAADLQSLLTRAGSVLEQQKREVIYQQGDAADNAFYISKGAVKLTVVSASGNEAIIAILDAGNFFGEGCLAGERVRMASATMMQAGVVVKIERKKMARILHEQHSVSDLFIKHMLARNIRIEADLVDQLFNSTEKRLARALLLLAQYGTPEELTTPIPKISQQTLAEMIGTTRARVSVFMNKFRKLGFIDYNGKLLIHSSLLSVVLHE
jgi:CRP/FNR family transcriptional regulator, cyclic AMP receptor protein